MDVGDGLLIERYYHYLFTSDSIAIDAFEQLGLGDAAGQLPVERGVRDRRADLALQRDRRPAALPPAAGGRAPADGVGAAAAAARPRRAGLLRAPDGELVDPPQHGRGGLAAGLGPADARQVRRAGRGDLDGVDLGQGRQAPQPARRRGAPGAVHLADGQLRAPVRRARAADRGGRRAGADRPPRRAARARRGRPGRRARAPRTRFGAASTPAPSRPAGRRSPTTRSSAASPTTSSPSSSTTTWPGRSAPSTSAASTRIEYFTALNLVLELERPLTEHFWVNIADRRYPFVGLIEHSNFVGTANTGGRVFSHVTNYLAADHELLALDADELLDRYEDGLRMLNPAFDRSWVRNRWVFREPAGQPIVRVGYPELIPARRTPGRGAAAGQHDADLSTGPGDQLRDPRRRTRRGRGAGAGRGLIWAIGTVRERLSGVEVGLDAGRSLPSRRSGDEACADRRQSVTRALAPAPLDGGRSPSDPVAEVADLRELDAASAAKRPCRGSRRTSGAASSRDRPSPRRRAASGSPAATRCSGRARRARGSMAQRLSRPAPDAASRCLGDHPPPHRRLADQLPRPDEALDAAGPPGIADQRELGQQREAERERDAGRDRTAVRGRAAARARG